MQEVSIKSRPQLFGFFSILSFLYNAQDGFFKIYHYDPNIGAIINNCLYNFN